MTKVDCVINVCQKPFQTALTLYSLLKHSSQHIDRIFFIEENVQLAGYEPADHSLLLNELKEKNHLFSARTLFFTGLR